MNSSNTLHFCTLFDKNYMSRGLSMYQSLVASEPHFHLYIFAFDDTTATTLQTLQLDHVTVITLAAFEDEELLRVKPTRSRGEYCWTCTSSTIWYCLHTFNLANCTYVDADLFFYQSPRVLIDEMPTDKHVMITEHRYTSYYDQSTISGKYCVQFMYFDQHASSLQVLQHWRNQCLEWCYNRIEEGKFGDQKYLDTWTQHFSCVHELQHLGGGLAPWNIQQYQFQRNKTHQLIGTTNASKKSFEAIFYHFHGFKFYDNGKFVYAPNTYRINHSIEQLFYLPYITALQNAQALLSKTDPSFTPHGSLSSKTYFKDKFLKGKFAYIKSNFIQRYWKNASSVK